LTIGSRSAVRTRTLYGVDHEVRSWLTRSTVACIRERATAETLRQVGRAQATRLLAVELNEPRVGQRRRAHAHILLGYTVARVRDVFTIVAHQTLIVFRIYTNVTSLKIGKSTKENFVEVLL
jgi:hypothetical protein